MEFYWSEKTMFTNYERLISVLTSYLKACDLFEAVEDNPRCGFPKRIRDKQKEKALKVFKKVIHLRIWMYIGDSRSPCNIWKLLESVISKHKGDVLTVEYWIQDFDEDEFILEDYGCEDATS